MSPLHQVLKAATTAAEWHSGQRRKGRDKEPYINHLLEVAKLVAEATEGQDANLTIAALLHDAIEDQNIPQQTIAELFNKDVASLVAEVTDDKSLPKEERKRLQIENASKKSNRAKILKLADKISNVTAIGSSPPDWPAKRRLEYIQWGRDVVAGLRGASRMLEQRFDESAREAEARTRESENLAG